MSTFPGGGNPPSVPVPIELVSAPQEGYITVRFLADPSGMLTHYRIKKPIHCPGPEDCPRKDHELPVIWKAYAPVELWRDAPNSDWIPAVFEVTVQLWEALKDQPLRGTSWKIWRLKTSRSPQEVAGEQIGEYDPDSLRKPFSMRAVLVRIYKTTNLVMDVPCPVPDRIFLMPTPGDAPPTAKDASGRSEYEENRNNGTAWRRARQAASKNGHNGKS